MGPADSQRLRPVGVVQRNTESCVTAVDITGGFHIFEKIGSAQTIIAAEVVVNFYAEAVLIQRRDIRQRSRAVNRNGIVPECKNSPRILAKAVCTWGRSGTAGVARIYQWHG